MTWAIEAMTDAEVMRELEELQTRFTDSDFEELERNLRLRAACLLWTGDPLKQSPRTVLACARQTLERRQP